jgi:hypothetical protein
MMTKFSTCSIYAGNGLTNSRRQYTYIYIRLNLFKPKVAIVLHTYVQKSRDQHFFIQLR